MGERKNNKDAVLLTVIGIATLLVAIVGATFAFFTARITDNDSSKTLRITSASGGTTTYTGGDPITMENIYPRDAAWATKPIMITFSNTNLSYAYTYKLVLHYTNTFQSGEIHYALTISNGYCTNGTSKDQSACQTAGGTWETTQAAGATLDGTNATGTFNNGSGNVQIATGTFNQSGQNQRHAYTLTIAYPDTGVNQNVNQEQLLTAWVEAVETTNS